MKRWLVAIAGVVVAVWLVRTSILFVDASESVYITQFGAHVATYDGSTDAGFHWKAPWPIQSALRFDRRLQVFDVPTQELLIRDRDETTGQDKPLPLTFDVYVCWRLGGKTAERDSVDQFVRSFGSLAKAEDFLRSLIISRLKVELSDMILTQLVNLDPSQIRTDELFRQVRSRPYRLGTGDADEPALSLEQRARQVGIEVVDIRLRRFNHPAQVRDEIFAKIREDRRREANNYRLQGEEVAARIRAEGELEAKRIRTDAEAEQARLAGRARAEATRILNEAHKQAPEFYRIVRMLDSYREMFADGKTQLIISLDHPLLALFKKIPQLSDGGTVSPGVPPRITRTPETPMPPTGNGATGDGNGSTTKSDGGRK